MISGSGCLDCVETWVVGVFCVHAIKGDDENRPTVSVRITFRRVHDSQSNPLNASLTREHQSDTRAKHIQSTETIQRGREETRTP